MPIEENASYMVALTTFVLYLGIMLGNGHAILDLHPIYMYSKHTRELHIIPIGGLSAESMVEEQNDAHYT